MPASRARYCRQALSRNQRRTSTAWRNGPSARDTRGVRSRRRWAVGHRDRWSTTWRGTSSVATEVTTVKPLWFGQDRVVRPVLPGVLRLPATRMRSSDPPRGERFTTFRGDHFAEKTSLAGVVGSLPKLTLGR